jgi:NADPH-dependent 2,4-dienoyl-CoA reductase/sulfur reductase-like enzyme
LYEKEKIMADYVIIGNGAAGRKAAEKIRKKDCTSSLTIITNELCPHYARPRLSLGFMSGEVDRDGMFIKPEFYSKNIVSLVFASVVGVEPAHNRIKLGDGSVLNYGKLLIASGASPVVPPWEGGTLEGVATLRTLRDAEDIIRRSEGAETVVVAGGGILGCEAAEALRKRGRDVKILVRGGKDKVGAPMLVPEKAIARCETMVENGIDVVINDEITRVTGDGKVEEVVTSGGRTIKTNLIVVTIGARANIGFLEGSGIKCGRAVIVDAELRCPDFPNIFAAGDAAEVTGDGKEKQAYGSPWINATKQGDYAAERMMETN